MAGQGVNLDFKDGFAGFLGGHCAFGNNVDTERWHRLSCFVALGQDKIDGKVNGGIRYEKGRIYRSITDIAYSYWR